MPNQTPNIHLTYLKYLMKLNLSKKKNYLMKLCD